MLLPLTVGVMSIAAYFSPQIWRQYHMAKIRQQVIRDRTLTLTYDDGPSEHLTLRILDLLKVHNAKASFFLLGRNAKKYPHVVDAMVREGHDVGCHSDEHVHAWKSAPWSAIGDINAGYRSLAPWVRPDGMFRPPYGKLTLPTYLAVQKRGAPMWWWTMDSGDSRDTLPQPSRIADALRRQRGGIVLLHDLEAYPARNDFVLETTAALLEVARTESMRVVPLRKLSYGRTS